MLLCEIQCLTLLTHLLLLMSLAQRHSSFMFNQPAFAPQPATVTRERTVCANHAVARNKNRNLVSTVGTGHRPGSRRLADICRQRGVASQFTQRNGPQRIPDFTGKYGAKFGQWRIECR